ncbi:tRNA glutamyl-Q(34) synthetase GluQRS [Alginatibacterium sediminis]|uniref:Glutamyl-Q tRNA(Asp) synthetase n=1 Tax=Alginatibacterium sediminis TaxID=2164068 RepID=A0A420E950_9ALTE|nr:tRNA glutamyl-Q(34) synthetase GluQRS [Alginatibacterium sediminis]RKF15853.1 tRNA glutamyl-Q(34) synthetase GluQRS [Alginatibacterium sediminis]
MSPYIGRFAPSPSGPLHLGSLVAAVGSYLQARAQQGQWLLRIEDIDPPREVLGATDTILHQLEQFSLHWDGPVFYQSHRSEAYSEQLQSWLSAGLAYYCDCTRKQIRQRGPNYDGHCRSRSLNNRDAAIRLIDEGVPSSFNDQLHGLVEFNDSLVQEDFIVRRRDGLFAYNLAVSLDDIEQGITEVVRGSDLLEPTLRQLYIYQRLGKSPPSYLHLPLVCADNGLKLSKQNHAPALSNHDSQQQLFHALTLLGQEPEPEIVTLSCETMLKIAQQQWDINKIPRFQALKPIDSL